jgi:hypothetical protein
MTGLTADWGGMSPAKAAMQQLGVELQYWIDKQV